MEQVNTMAVRHQNFMQGVRQLLGWPLFKPMNDSIVFCAGREIDFQVGSELARITQLLGKDAVYTSWTSETTATPASFAIVYRELLTVDVIDGVVPYAADDHSPIVFLNIRAAEIFQVDQRGSLVRLAGKPPKIGTGRKLAMKRIRAAAAAMNKELLANNRHVPFGAEWIEPEAPAEAIVRFA